MRKTIPMAPCISTHKLVPKTSKRIHITSPYYGAASASNKSLPLPSIPTGKHPLFVPHRLLGSRCIQYRHRHSMKVVEQVLCTRSPL